MRNYAVQIRNVVAAFSLSLVPGLFAANFTEISTETMHLGGAAPEWSIFEGRKPQGTELRLKFDSKQNSREQTLFIRQDDVKQDWSVTLNGQKLGQLFLMEADLIHTLSIPPEGLRDGVNELHISSKSSTDDVLLHAVSIADDSRTNTITGGPLQVGVTDAGGKGLPARITITDSKGSLAALHVADTNSAARPGVVYTGDGTAKVFLIPGEYTVYASRGPEYSLEKSEVTIGHTEVTVQLTLTNEVKTAGWIASDTHIHTLSLSKHGDALLHERMITLAAEGVELPIATEHNLHADYHSAAQESRLEKYFTIIPGNEVTTKRGHFNIFPISLSAKPVDHTIEHWPDLLASIRKSPDVRVTILNHPTDTHSGFTPFASTNFNRLTGKNLRGNFDFTFDAVEVINSGAMRSDWMEPFTCWFALLNRGYKIVGVGSSDAHDVSRFIVGQGRTYIRGDDSQPSNINIQQACENLKRGRAVVSLGLFPQLAIADAPDALDAPSLTTGVVQAAASGPGDLHAGTSNFFEITASIDFPTWTNPAGRTTATLYENGRPKLVFPFEIAKLAGKPLAFKARFPKPNADAWYVLIANTPGVTNAYWSISRPYQPSSPKWEPEMIGATNPIYLDGNGDGLYTSPRRAALHLNEQYISPHDLIVALDEYDWATIVQVAELLHEAGHNLAGDELKPTLARASIHVQQGFEDYISTISKR